MFKYIASCCILFCWMYPDRISGQTRTELSFEQTVELLYQNNRSLKIATREIEWAESEHGRLNAFWYPTVNASGAYVHLSNKIEVKEPLSQFTDPAKDFVHSILPDDRIISSILDQIGGYSLRFPLMPQDITTIDANVTWPIFTGGKRIYAGKIGKETISLARLNREQVGAELQILLVESYFGLRLGERVVDVREQAYQSLKRHYDHALALERNGMLDKAGRLFVRVNMDEAKRELEAARKELHIAQQALKTLIQFDSASDIRPVTSLFINDSLPEATCFKNLIEGNNYLVRQIRLQEQIATVRLNMGRTGYLPDIALFGKQSLYAHGIEKNLLPRTLVGVGFTWNLFDGLNREKQIRQAKISRQTLALGREKAIDDLGVAIDKFYSQTQNALDNVTALRSTIDLSRELVRMRQRAFQEGMATPTEIIDAEVMLAKVQIASLLAYYQYDIALIRLLCACGIPESFFQYSEGGKTEAYIFDR